MMEDKDLNLAMFKAYDIRTKEELMNQEMAQRVIDAMACYFIDVVKARSVVLGRDARLGVPRLMQTAIDTFPLYGIDVIVNPLQVSTCQFYYSCMQNPDSCGIMFTASHNPKNYIGMKIIVPTMLPLAAGNGPEGGIEKIRQLYIENSRPAVAAVRGKLIIRRYLDQFIRYSMELAGVKEGSLSGLHIICDFLGGAVGTEITEALQYAGADVLTRNIVPDGRFPVGDPNPIVLSSIQPTWDLIRKGGFDFGLAFDGDGDRMDFMSSEGRQLAPSFNFSILIPEISRLYASRFKKITVYSDVKVNPLAQALQARNADVKIIRNGHSFIKEALREGQEEGCMAACEESAHYYMNFPFDMNDLSKGFAATENTLFFSLLTARLFHEQPELYKQAFIAQDSTYRVREFPVNFKHSSKMEQAMERVQDLFRKEGLDVFDQTDDGRSLDATLMRSGIPQNITAATDLSGPWFQVAQRISRSEDMIARWEITGSDPECIEAARRKTAAVLDEYIKEGEAEYV